METSDGSFGANKIKYLGLEIAIATVESGDEASVSFELSNKKMRLLSASAIEDVIMGKELSDIDISLAQNLLKGQFPYKLWDLHSKVDKKEGKMLQIVHCTSQHHWIVNTTALAKSMFTTHLLLKFNKIMLHLQSISSPVISGHPTFLLGSC